MSGMAARLYGYRLVVHSPSADSPAGQIADFSVVAPLDDVDAACEVAQRADVVTYEFENVASEPVFKAAEIAPVYPSPEILRIAQHRRFEKEALRKAGVPVADYAPIRSPADLREALARFPGGAILKTATGGYDGKGQRVLRGDEPVDAEEVFRSLAGPESRELILERRLTFECELSVIVARNAHGQWAALPVAENVHRDGILHLTLVPARVPERTAEEAREIARTIAESLGLIGLLAVEMFATERGLVVNEIAPRPHNSGHFSLDACLSSQFDQHVRAVAGLPLGESALRQPVVMLNLLGEHLPPLYRHFEEIIAIPNLRLHLYGKEEARKGRKMGHINVVAESTAEALRVLHPVWERLRPDDRPLID